MEIAEERASLNHFFKTLADSYSSMFDLDLEQIFTPAELAVNWARVARTDNLDFLTVMTGRKGLSKTTGGYWLGREYYIDDCRPYVIKGIDFVRKNIVPSTLPEELVEAMKIKFTNTPRFSALLVDEAKGIGYKRNFASTVNKQFVTFLGECRKWANEKGEFVGNKLTVLCLDNFFMLDSDVKKSVNGWIHQIGKGIGVYFCPDPMPCPDPFFTEDLMKLTLDYKRKNKLSNSQMLDIRHQLAVFRQLPTFEGIFVFPNMDLVIKAEGADGTPVFKQYDLQTRQFNEVENKGIAWGDVEKTYLDIDGEAKAKINKTRFEQANSTAESPRDAYQKVREKNVKRIIGLLDLLKDRSGLTQIEISRHLTSKGIPLKPEEISQLRSELSLIKAAEDREKRQALNNNDVVNQ